VAMTSGELLQWSGLVRHHHKGTHSHPTRICSIQWICK